jgi:hypothetical protein
VMLSGRSIGLRDSGAGFLLFAWFGLALFLHCTAIHNILYRQHAVLVNPRSLLDVP